MSAILQNDLQQSIIYNLSMCSLENFHTCFLKWLGQNYPKEFLKIFTDKISNNAEIIYETQVNYGKNNILDLQIQIKDINSTEYIIIENKLKSFPTDEQLRRYQECFKNKKAKFILLSFAPKFNIPTGWKYMSYKELAEKMDGAFSYKNNYDKNLIEDYINVIKTISTAFPSKNTHTYDFYEENPLDELGLKDIYVKYRTSELTDYIRENVNDSSWYIGYSFHNKKGTIDMFKDFENPAFKLGLQIEGCQYRYCLITQEGDSSEQARKNRENIARELFTNGFWFCKTNNTERGRLYTDFCGYNPDFIYRYFMLNKHFRKENLKDVSYKEIIEQIQNDMNNLNKNIDTIKKIVSKNIQ